MKAFVGIFLTVSFAHFVYAWKPSAKNCSVNELEKVVEPHSLCRCAKQDRFTGDVTIKLHSCSDSNEILSARSQCMCPDNQERYKFCQYSYAFQENIESVYDRGNPIREHQCEEWKQDKRTS